MVRVEVVWIRRLLGRQTLTSLSCLPHLFALTIEVGQRREVLGVIETNRYLRIVVIIIIVTAVLGPSLSTLRSRLLTQSPVHQTPQRVLFQLDIAGLYTLNFLYLQIVHEVVHNCAEQLSIELRLRSIRVNSSLQKFTCLVFIIHDHEYLIRQFLVRRRFGYLRPSSLSFSFNSIIDHVTILTDTWTSANILVIKFRDRCSWSLRLSTSSVVALWFFPLGGLLFFFL